MIYSEALKISPKGVKGIIRCSYAEIYNKDHQKVFSYQSYLFGDFLVTGWAGSGDYGNNYTRVGLTTAAQRVINDYVNYVAKVGETAKSKGQKRLQHLLEMCGKSPRGVLFYSEAYPVLVRTSAIDWYPKDAIIQPDGMVTDPNGNPYTVITRDDNGEIVEKTATKSKGLSTKSKLALAAAAIIAMFN